MVDSARLGRRAGVVVIAIPVLLGGGTELQSLALAKVLIASGRQVTVCCYHESDPAVVALFECVGARVVRLDLPRRKPLAGVAVALRSTFRTLRPDVVHVQYLAPGFTAVLAARAAGVRKVVSTVHQPLGANGSRARLLLRAASRLCAAFCCVSLAVERSWFGDAAVLDPERPLPRRWRGTVYNPVDASAVAAAARGADRLALRREIGFDDGSLVLGFVGRLRREKGLDLLIRALPSVAATCPGVRLLVVGDGPEAGALRALAQDSGVGERVRWLGTLERVETWRRLAAVDLAVAPSRFEGFGLAAAEAQAAGLPVVAAGVGGLCEVVADGETGLLVRPEDPGACADAVLRVLRDPEAAREMGRRGRERVRELFSVGRFSRATLAVYATAPQPPGWA